MDNQLTHYGVLGMKWGVRKARGSSSVSTRRKSKGEELKNISDDELRKKINRMQMEKQYKQLTSKESNAGAKIAKDILLNASKVAVTTYITKYLSDSIASTLDPVLRKK